MSTMLPLTRMKCPHGGMASALLAALALCASIPLHAQPQETGSMTVGGSAHVRGPVVVHGPLVVAGRVHARGPLTAAYFTGPAAARGLPYAGGYYKVFDGPVTVHGTMVVNGDLLVDGPLTVDGPLEASGGIDADGPMRERYYGR
ncbi:MULTISPECIES: hypothetical protein [Cupriavidus]|uniref:Polymer-forming cytoskeletal protein n=1 Tax=Cupriavidus pinatubonensis (strain JMP 134 / LMG 1197) TaxID=264198 RepID=Q46T50_CUPPJ|nr:hypothetical protein [Cupriavidus pinatubonensis]